VAESCELQFERGKPLNRSFVDMNREICQKLERCLVIAYERSVNFGQSYTSSRFECDRDVSAGGFRI
jgi:hypothetical protein